MGTIIGQADNVMLNVMQSVLTHPNTHALVFPLLMVQQNETFLADLLGRIALFVAGSRELFSQGPR